METYSLRQPVIKQNDFEYEEQAFFKEYEGYCYHFIGRKDFVLLPDGNIHLLYDVDDGKPVLSMLDNATDFNKLLFFEGNEHHYFGISLHYTYQYEVDKEKMLTFSKAIYEEMSFLKKFAYCEQHLKYLLFQTPNHTLLVQAVNRMIRTRGQVSIESLAVEQGYTVRQAERIFMEYYGISPKRLNRFVRLHFAMDKMKEWPDCSFVGIAEQLKFSDASHFLREFKYFANMTPKEFTMKYFKR